MRGFHNNSFDPQTLVLLEGAFDEAWLTLKAIGNTTVKPDELARCVLRLAMDGERDPVAEPPAAEVEDDADGPEEDHAAVATDQAANPCQQGDEPRHLIEPATV